MILSLRRCTLTNQDRLYLAFYGSDFNHRFTKIIEHDEQQWQYLDELVNEATDYGVEPLALAMFFGATSDPLFHINQERLSLLSEETLAYQGRTKVIEQGTVQKKARASRWKTDSGVKSLQPQLL